MSGKTKKRPSPRGRPKITAPALEPLDAQSNEPIDKQVYQAIRRSIMSGGLPPGGRLSSRSIADALGVSPMPVREALKRLDADGVIHSAAKSGFLVHDLTAVEYEEILTIRLQIESLLIREAAAKITPEEVDQATWLLERMKASKDWSRVLQYNYQLHFLAYQAAHMPYALSITENIWLRVGPALHRVEQKVPLTQSTKHLSNMVKALRNKNPILAEKHLRTDIEINATALLGPLQKKDAKQSAA